MNLKCMCLTFFNIKKLFIPLFLINFAMTIKKSKFKLN